MESGTPIQHKPTMFLMMVECATIFDIYEWYDRIKDFPVNDLPASGVFMANPPGHLGDSVPIALLHERDIQPESLGSVCFKFIHDGKKIAVLVFKNGRMKVSGGYPAALILQDSVTAYNAYLDKLIDVIERMTLLDCGEKTISCLNGQLHLVPFPNALRLAGFIESHKNNFQRIVYPQMDTPGRRCAYKLYIHANVSKKTHIAVDWKGKAQIFGAKSHEELYTMFEIFNSRSGH